MIARQILTFAGFQRRLEGMFLRVLGAWVIGLGLVNMHAAVTVLEEARHLGVRGEPEWAIFEGGNPQGTNLVLNFDAPKAEGEQTMFIRQDDVKQDWTVTLNGRRLGLLFLMEGKVVHTLSIPAGLLKESGNRMEIAAKGRDDIRVGPIWIEKGSKADLLGKHVLQVKVREAGRAVPCRITIEDAEEHLAALHNLGSTNAAVRPGVVYTGDGQARMGVRPGRYAIYATRGPEYSVGRTEVVIGDEPGVAEVALELKREVDTQGWIAVDTHIHTLTLSKHGDATLRERVVTIAGEALDLGVVTEHNLHADYGEAARELGLGAHFSTVPGNEVTTKKGHFNIFPVSLSAPPPDHTVEHWPDLFERMRKVPEVGAIIINHPTDVHAGFVPFASTNLDLATGRNLRGDFNFEFDGCELVNSSAMNSDWMAPFRAWFALLNRGYRVTGVGSSDSHDVSRFIVGQGRTYVRGDDSDPGKIDAKAVAENLKLGRAVVSLGLFPMLSAREKDGSESVGPGEVLHCKGDGLVLEAAVSSPSWIRAERAIVYANGQPLFTHELEPANRQGSSARFKLQLPRPKQDTMYVLVAHGPGVTNQFWGMARPYQPTSKEWEAVAIGSTNPIFVDADGDGKFSSPREYAEGLAKLRGEEARAKLGDYDAAVAAQFAEIQGGR